MFRNGQFREGKLSLQFKNVLRACSLFILHGLWLAYLQTPKKRFLKDNIQALRDYQESGNAQISHPNDYIDDFCIETESTILSGNLLERMKPNGTYLNYQVCWSSSGSLSFLYY